MRWLGLLITVSLLVGQTPALGAGLMLEEPPRTDFTVYGWTFLVLSLTMGAYAQQSLTASEDALASATASYASYQGAADATDAASFRTATEGFLASARSEEERANGALFLAVLFGLTSYYSFFPSHAPDTSIIVHPRGLALVYRF